jgi:hypothetical protein
MSVIVFDEMHDYSSEEERDALNEYHASLIAFFHGLSEKLEMIKQAIVKALEAGLERALLTWDKLKDFIDHNLPKHPEVIHPAAKVRYAKQRIHSLVTIRKPMMIRARTCC